MSYSGLGTDQTPLKLTTQERTALYERAMRLRERVVSLKQRCPSLVIHRDFIEGLVNRTPDQIRSTINGPLTAFGITEFEGMERGVIDYERQCPTSTSSGTSPLVWVGLGVAALGIGFVVFQKMR